MDPFKVIPWTDFAIGGIRELINSVKKNKTMWCHRCQATVSHKFDRIKPLGIFASVGKRVYKCEQCGKEVDIDGKTVI